MISLAINQVNGATVSGINSVNAHVQLKRFRTMITFRFSINNPFKYQMPSTIVNWYKRIQISKNKSFDIQLYLGEPEYIIKLELDGALSLILLLNNAELKLTFSVNVLLTFCKSL